MKIRKVIFEDRNKVYGLFSKVFSRSSLELQVLKNMHKNNKIIYEWACIHTNKNVAYIAFSNAYKGEEVCGVHLLHLIVKPDFQDRGIGTELLHFALRQQELKSCPVYALGNVKFFQKFGFEVCSSPQCKLGSKSEHFLSIRNDKNCNFIIGYEPEYRVC